MKKSLALRQLCRFLMCTSFVPLARRVVGTVSFVLIASTVSAQVFDPGPSDPNLFDTVLNIPPDPSIGDDQSIESSTQLNLYDGGSIGLFFNAGSPDGSSSNVEANIFGGTVGYGFGAMSGSEVNISGGIIGRPRTGITAFGGSVMNISGGNIVSSISAFPNSVVNVDGGVFHSRFNVRSNGNLKVRGGAIFGLLKFGDVELIGGEFLLNGIPYQDPSITFGGNDVFSGTLMDGSTFIFNQSRSGYIHDVTLVSSALPALDLAPIVIETPNPDRPSGLRAGQSLTLRDGGLLNANFAVVSAELNIEGGDLGDGAESTNSVVNISGGTIGSSFDAYSGSEVNISGGSVGSAFRAQHGSVVNVSGGSVGESFFASSGSVVNISGGTVGETPGDFITAESGSVLNISGGTLQSAIQARSGSVVNISGGILNSYFYGLPGGQDINIFGREFFLDGQPVTGTTINEARTITEREIVLSGLLADGSPFSFNLDPFVPSGVDSFPIDATINVTVVPVPEPKSLTIIWLAVGLFFPRCGGGRWCRTRLGTTSFSFCN